MPFDSFSSSDEVVSEVIKPSVTISEFSMDYLAESPNISLSSNPEKSENIFKTPHLSAVDTVAKDIYGNELKVVTDIDFDTQLPQKTIHYQTIKWLCLIVVMLLALFAQYLRYISPYWSKNPDDYQMASTLCQYLQCNIPARINTNKIMVQKLLVREAPGYENVLNIDTIIYNNANFSQPYPDIDLYFTDTNAQVVAQRRLKPSEYLNKETLNTNTMPVKMPIYISFQIIDPSAQAVGYSLHFSPAK